METNESFSEPNAPAPSTPPALELSNAAMVDLLEARKWAKFISIVAFIGLGIMVIAGLVIGVFLGTFLGDAAGLPFPGGVLGIFYVGMAIVYFFPILYLYRFANSAGKAVLYRNPDELSVAIKNLRSHYQYLGIVMLILLGVYLVFILFAIVTSGF
jgi:hypothetical protein